MIATLMKSRWRKQAVKPAGVGSSEFDDEDEEPEYKPLDWKLVRRLGTLLRPYRRTYLWGTGLGLIHISLELAGPKFMQKIIDYVTAYAGGTLPVKTDATGASYHVAYIVAIWAVALAASMVLQRFTILIMTYAGERVQFDIRRKLFFHLQELSMSYYDKTRLGRIISRCTSDVGAMREVNVWGIWQVAANAMMTVVAAIMLAVTDWRIFLAVCWLGPVIYLTNTIYKKRAMGVHQLAREGWTRVSTNLCENITGMRVVTAFNRQGPNLGVFNRLQDQNTNNNMRVAVVNGLYQPLLSIIAFTGRVIILVFGGYLIATGRMKSVGAVVAAYLYWDWFMNPIINFGNFYSSQIMPAMTGAERVFNLLDQKPEVLDDADAQMLPRITGRVEFEKVTFGYNPERPVLHDVSFVAEPGQMFALVGATGSGKSSIVSLIARFYQPQSGRVLVDGRDIRHVTGESLHQQMGLVLQVNYLFSGTVMENIRYASPTATEEDVIAAARRLGTYDSIASLNAGFHSEVGERGGNMSLGQRQLICFTRAYLADPRIFMLDEATSAVDTATELLVQRSLEKLLQGRTTFVVAHRLSTIMKADQILVIDAGRIVERGTHRELLKVNGKYAHLYNEFVKHAE
ncbi:MAG TPA: ABC transporter ATP-binding protein [Tepidisphaeraceae bacterium]|jgi:ATP-binding cassette subfamily B protein|nr:ABC transporter ATP-binding protein [Tepidisphaeraceae bacterium]